MKKLLPLILLWVVIDTLNLTGQSLQWAAEPGTCGGNCEQLLDGNGTLGQIYNNQACGLNFVQASNRIGQRFTPAGTGNPSVFNISGIPACATIVRAYLWAGTSGNGAAMTINITNPTGSSQSFPMAIVGTGPDKCWSYAGTRTYRADVTSIISGNGNYSMTGFLTGSPNDVDGATLMIIYQDPQATYRGHIILHDGAVVINGGTTTQTVTGINACANSTFAVAFSAIADLQMAGTLTMNGTNAPFTWNWWNYTQVNTNITNGQANSNFTMNSGGDCYNFAMAGIYYQTTSCVTCPSASTLLTLNFNTTNPSCAANDGAITVNPTGVSGPYTYVWSNGATSQTITNLGPGTYTVTVSANNGCLTNSATVTLVQSNGGINLNPVITPVSCYGGNNGSIQVNASGGSGSFSYLWNPNLGNTNTISNLTAGSYTVTVTDQAGCTISATYAVSQPAQLSVTPSQTNVLCNGGATGSASVNVSGGAGSYQYSWSNGAGNVSTANNLNAGSYTVTVIDGNGCTISQTFTITEPSGLSVSIPTQNHPSCFGGSNGSLTALGNGGLTPYAGYSWSNGTTGTTNASLSSGTYTVTLTDYNGCTATATATLINPAQLTISITQTGDVSCFGGNDGFIEVTSSGGTGNLSYAWTPGGFTTEDIQNIGAASYSVIVSDQNGCSATAQVTINEPPVLTVDIISVTDASCYGYNDGALEAQASGGTGNYTVQWFPSGGSNLTANLLTAGLYTITVTDQNNCSASDQASVSEPALFTVQASVSDNNICLGESTDLDVTNNGGVGNINYVWNNTLQGTQHSVSPTQGTYYVIAATDEQNCIAWDSVWVMVNPLPQISFTFNNACENQTVNFVNNSTIALGTIANYQWDFGNNSGTSNLDNPSYSYTNNGTYVISLTAISDQGCISSSQQNLQIFDTPAPSFSADITQGCVPLCVNFSDASQVMNASVNSWGWSANSQQISASQNPGYCFQNPGTYDIMLEITSSQGCSNLIVLNDYIQVYPNPISEFTISSNSIPFSNPIVEFTDASLLANSWLWNFGDGYSASNVQNGTHSYPDTGNYCITLTVSTSQGCTDQTIRCLNIFPDFNIYIPNTFTPNGDKMNDYFYVHGNGIKALTMLIFNRWGELIYETADVQVGWNGLIRNSQTEAAQGVYNYKIEVTDHKNEIHTFYGNVNLIR